MVECHWLPLTVEEIDAIGRRLAAAAPATDVASVAAAQHHPTLVGAIAGLMAELLDDPPWPEAREAVAVVAGDLLADRNDHVLSLEPREAMACVLLADHGDRTATDLAAVLGPRVRSRQHASGPKCNVCGEVLTLDRDAACVACGRAA